MQSIEVPMTVNEWHKLGVVVESASLNMMISLAESDVKEHLENQGRVSMESLIENLSYPRLVVVMSLGALVRDGLVRVIKSGDSILLEEAAS